MKKWIGLIIFAVIVVLLIIVALLPTDEDKYLKEITYSEFVTKVNNKDSFILYVKQTGCAHCKEFTPKFAGVLSDNKITAYVVNLTNLSEEEKPLFKESTGVDGTPMVFFYKDGVKSMIYIEGEQSKDKIISKLKSAGFIDRK